MQLAVGQLPVGVHHVLNVFRRELLEKLHNSLDIEQRKSPGKPGHLENEEQILSLVLHGNHL